MSAIVKIFKGLCKVALAIILSVLFVFLSLILFILFVPEKTETGSEGISVVNDVTRLNPTSVLIEIQPSTIQEISEALKGTDGPVSIGGGRFSMGGQIASSDSLHIDMRKFNQVVKYSKEEKEITVQSGITWRDIQDIIDADNLSVKIMQSYSNFTVGGSLSVNAHGRYMGYGAMVHSVKSIKLVMADGSIVNASPEENKELFYSSIGGYGGIAVIAEVTLKLADNLKLERSINVVPAGNYLSHFMNEVDGKAEIIMHNADLIPPMYDTAYITNWIESDKELTVRERLQERGSDPWTFKVYRFLIDLPFGKRLRPLMEKFRSGSEEVVWRNYEASYDVKSLGVISDDQGSYILQEYFIPIDSFDSFRERMSEILEKNDVDVINISVRHALADEKTFLSWSPEDVFAFVLYYYQPKSAASLEKAGIWTRELIDVVLENGGRYYLPYITHASLKQFEKAYSRLKEFYSIKSRVDPLYKFRNIIWDSYYKPETGKRIEDAYKSYSGSSRPEVNTFLTLPEWLLVFMSEDQAYAYMNVDPLSFGYFKAIGDFWSLYLDLIKRTRKDYVGIPWDYHIMNITIGISTTIEYLVKGIYEQTIGRLSSLFRSNENNEIELFIGNTYNEYALFLRNTPWYEFDFSGKRTVLSKLETGLNIRLIERKFSFMFELWIKEHYANLIRSGTEMSFEKPPEYTYAIVDSSLNADITSVIEDLTAISDGISLKRFPRYQKFTDTVINSQGFHFKNIAGNESIVVSGNFDFSCEADFDGELVYDLPSWSGREMSRKAYVVSVSKISEIVKGSCMEGEYFYDY
ncbi:MAG TPA: FAD-binding oxidoreductase [Oligoflexia bacterium]|nr:FAD-binding oxidoreductase [Oligoflexia bacterium]HMP48047.1 FAD-binding oxidoreductase [Oligoflexia bacterium]